MPRNWIREYELIAGPGGGMGFRVTDLHISFSCEKTEDETLNNIKIDIWNLNEEHRKMLEQKDCAIKLSAGYRGNIKQIFVGTVTYAESEKDGADYKTSLECADGRVACRDTQVSSSYSGSTNSKTVLDDIANEMNLPISYGQDVQHIDIPNGYSFVGNATGSLDQVCDSAGLSWSIQDGELQIKKNKGTMSKLGYRLASDTGLINIPKKQKQSGENSNDKGESGYEVTFFMNSDIKINDYVFLDTREVKGYFRVASLSISGDNMSGDWVCKAKLLEDGGDSDGSVSSATAAANPASAAKQNAMKVMSKEKRLGQSSTLSNIAHGGGNF